MTSIQEIAEELDGSIASTPQPATLNEFGSRLVLSDRTGTVALAAIEAMSFYRSHNGGKSVGIWGDLKSHPSADCWRDLALVAKHPRVVARLADVAWCANPARRELAELAIHAHRDCAGSAVMDEVRAAVPAMKMTTPDGSPVQPIPGTEWTFGAAHLTRARDLAGFVNSEAVVTEIGDLSRELLQEQLALGHGRAAVWLLDVVKEPPARRPSWFSDEALRVLKLLESEPGEHTNFIKSLLETLRTCEPPTGFPFDWSEFINQSDLDSQLAWALSREGLARYVLLGEAYQFAQDRDMAIADDLLDDWNAIDPLELLQKVRHEVPLDAGLLDAARAEVDDLVSSVFSPADAIRSLGARLPADPTYQVARPGLSSWFPTYRLGAGRNFVTDSEDERTRLAWMSEVLNHALMAASLIHVPLLARLHATVGADVDVWKDAWEGDWFDETAASRLAEALRLYYENRPDASCHLLAPTIEEGLRKIARHLGLAQRHPARPRLDYVPPLLGTVVERLSGEIPENWRLWLSHLLVDPMGFNLRNTIAHGTESELDEQRATLLLNAAAWIASFEAPLAVNEEE